MLLPLFSLFVLSSCKTQTDPYKNIEKDSNRLTDNGKLTNKYENGDKFIIDLALEVYFDGVKVDYLTNKEKIEQNHYFVTTSNETPSLSRIIPESTLGTNKQSYNLNFYIAYVDSNDKVYVSTAKPVTITNSKALNPILYYVGGGFIIVAVAAIVYFSKRYKEKHPN